MAAIAIAKSEIEDQSPDAGSTQTLSDWQRRRILIAAAAAAALGAPVRILDIRPAAGAPSRWVRKGRLTSQSRGAPRARRPAPQAAELPQPEAREGESES
ncbi:MAG: hypothetical protein LAQ30_13395 [Acidobacteriia bacterium]|nr:hypothetical protein [Terriglobia bacterium]